MQARQEKNMMEPVKNAEGLLTVKDVQRVLSLSRSKVYQLKTAGILPPVKLAGCSKVLFAPADVRAYLAAGRGTATASVN